MPEVKKVKSLTRDDVRQYLFDQTFPVSHSKSKSEKIGMEVEMLPLIGSNLSEVAHLQGRDDSILNWLQPLGRELLWKEKVESISNAQGVSQNYVTLIELEEGDNISFEPGGQVEISSKPYSSLTELSQRVLQLRTQLAASLGYHGIDLVGIGFNPMQSSDQIGLQMMKKRYVAMDQYFSQLGPWGRQMMRQTCTVQVCLDFGPSEETMARRFWLAQMVAPMAAGIFANSPFVNQKPAGLVGYRSKIWRNIDSSRTGLLLPSGELNKHNNQQSLIDVYEEFLLNSNVVFIPELNYEVPVNFSFRSWMKDGYKGIFPNLADLEVCLSLLFSEVRPRGFFELRSVDNQHLKWLFVPAIFWTTLLYSEVAMSKAWDLLYPIKEHLSELLRRSEFGLSDPELKHLSQELMKIVIENYSTLPDDFRNTGVENSLILFAEKYTFRGLTPGDQLLKLYESLGKGLGREFWKRLNDIENKLKT